MLDKKATILTLGCRVNQYESDYIAEQLEKEGISIVKFGTQADVCIINTCSVTAESDRKSAQFIRKAAKQYKNAYIIVCGCSTEHNKSIKENIPEITYLFGNANKDKIPSYIINLLSSEKIQNIDIDDINNAPYDNMHLNSSRRAKGYIKIEDGCDNKCAYCIIPQLRGHVRSRNKESILNEVRTLVKNGCKEIILTGIETSAYGYDFNEKNALANLILEIDRIDGVKRLSMGSLTPTLMKEDFLIILSKCKSLVPHFHISLQSGCSKTLARMRRKYNAEQAEIFINNIRKYFPDAHISADIITGFPGETDEEFEETKNFIKTNKLFHLHVFPYSERQNTEASFMPNKVDESIRKLRAKELIEIQNEIKHDILNNYCLIHKDDAVNVLVEQLKNGYLIGHSEHNVEIKFKGPKELIENIVPCKALKVENDYLICEKA